MYGWRSANHLVTLNLIVNTTSYSRRLAASARLWTRVLSLVHPEITLHVDIGLIRTPHVRSPTGRQETSRT